MQRIAHTLQDEIISHTWIESIEKRVEVIGTVLSIVYSYPVYRPVALTKTWCNLNVSRGSLADEGILEDSTDDDDIIDSVQTRVAPGNRSFTCLTVQSDLHVSTNTLEWVGVCVHQCVSMSICIHVSVCVCECVCARGNFELYKPWSVKCIQIVCLHVTQLLTET